MEDTRPICPWKLDANGYTSDIAEPEGGCRLPPGFRGWVFHEVPDPAAWQEAPQRAKLPARKAAKVAHPKKELPVSLPRTPVVLSPPADEPVADAPAPAPAPVATVGVPAVPSADDLSRIAAHAGGGATGIIMALIAVVGGGGAVWKYLQSKQKAASKKAELEHEQRMKELELQADNQRRDDDKHKECESARLGLASRVESMEQQGRLAEKALSDLRDRLDAVSAKADSAVEKAGAVKVGGSEDVDERLDTFSKRISKLETAVKSKKGVR